MKTITRLVLHLVIESPLYFKWTLKQRLSLIKEATINFGSILGTAHN